MNANAEALYGQATYAQKSGNAARAAELFQQVIDNDDARRRVPRESR